MLAIETIDFMPILWLAIIVLAGILEASTMNLTSIWFIGGALVAVIAYLFGAPDWLQITLFIVVSAALLVSLRPVFSRYLKKNDIKTNVDRLIGKPAICTAPITEIEHGEVKIDGKIWTAVAQEKIQIGEKVEVLAIDGVKLMVKKVE